MPPPFSFDKSLVSRRASSMFPNLRRLDVPTSPAPSSSSDQPAVLPLSPPPARRTTSSDSPSTPELLNLKLTGPSFLDTIVRDTVAKKPLYLIETVAECTHLYRLGPLPDHYEKVATVQWPQHVLKSKTRSGCSVQIGSGSWRDAEDILKRGTLGNIANRRFNVPRYPHTLRWKLTPGNVFQCTTTATKEPVASLAVALLSTPPRLKVYQTLIDGDIARSQDNFNGVPVLFLDYLVITAFLLVTDVQEYLDRPVGHVRIPGSSARIIQRWLAIIHDTPLPSEPEPKPEPEPEPGSPVRSPVDSHPDGSLSELSPSTGTSRDRLSTFSSLAPGGPSISDSHSPSTSDFSSLPRSVSGPSPNSPFYFDATQSNDTSMPRSPPAHMDRVVSLTRRPNPAPPRELPLPHPFAAASLTRSASVTSIVGVQRPSTAPSQVPSLPTPAPSAPPRVRRQLPVPPVPTPSCVPPPSLPSPTGPVPPISSHNHSASFSHSQRARAAAEGMSSRPPSPTQSASSSSASASASGSSDASRHLVRRSFHRGRSVPPALPPPPGAAPLPPKLAQEYQYARTNQHQRVDEAEYDEVRSYMPPLRVQNGTPERAVFAQTQAGMMYDGHGGGSGTQLGGLVGAMDGLHLQHHAPSAGPSAVVDMGFALGGDERASVYDMPPPAYEAHDFDAPPPHPHAVMGMGLGQRSVSGRGTLPRTLPSLPPQAQALQR